MPLPTILHINLDAENQSLPKYKQLADAIVSQIKTGILKSGDMLPSSREMAQQLGVSRKTIVAATELLVLKRWLVSKDRVGLFVAGPSPSAAKPAVRHDSPVAGMTFGGDQQAASNMLVVNDGFPDTQLMPFREFSRTYRQVFNRAAQWQNLGYGTPVGYHRFCHSLTTMLGSSRGLGVEDNELCIVRGSQMALFLIANAVLSAGDHVAIESPGYEQACRTFKAAGLVVHEIPVDGDGLDTEHLARLCEDTELHAVYVTPRYQYPTTVTLSQKRRQQLCDLSVAHGFFVIEDDFGADFQFSGKHQLPLSAMLPKSHYLYVGTFSKIFAPAIRVGYVASSAEVIQRIASYRSLVDIQGDAITERALNELYDNGDMQRHIRRTSRIYKERLDFVSKEIRRLQSKYISYHRPIGGLAIWLNLGHANLEFMQCLLREQNVSVPLFMLSDGSLGARIGYASLTEEQVTKVLTAIADCTADFFENHVIG